MPRPRMPAQVLEMKGSYVSHPEQKREDPEGKGVLTLLPPSYLRQDVVPIWHELVGRLPMITFTATDEYAVAQMARVEAAIRKLDLEAPDGIGAFDPRFKALDAAKAVWTGKLGLSPPDRAKLGKRVENPKQNRFAKLNQAG